MKKKSHNLKNVKQKKM